MAIKDMEKSDIDTTQSVAGKFLLRESLASVAVGNTILVPNQAKKIGLWFTISGGASCKVKAAGASHAIIKAGLATFIDDDYGTISSSCYLEMDALPTAIQIEQTVAGAVVVDITAF